MRVLVCGGRDFADANLLSRVLNNLHQQHVFSRLIQGGARGADWLAAEWAVANGVPVSSFPAAWDKYGKSAGAIRNAEMLDKGKPDLVVAFPGGRGTAHMVSIAKQDGVAVQEIAA